MPIQPKGKFPYCKNSETIKKGFTHYKNSFFKSTVSSEVY